MRLHRFQGFCNHPRVTTMNCAREPGSVQFILYTFLSAICGLFRMEEKWIGESNSTLKYSISSPSLPLFHQPGLWMWLSHQSHPASIQCQPHICFIQLSVFNVYVYHLKLKSACFHIIWKHFIKLQLCFIYKTMMIRIAYIFVCTYM